MSWSLVKLINCMNEYMVNWYNCAVWSRYISNLNVRDLEVGFE